MAKKRVKRAVHKKISGRRIISNSRGGNINYTRASTKKLKMVMFNLILFIILGVVSYILYHASVPLSLYSNLFYLLSFLFGFVILAFFIALLILLILRGMGK